MKEKWGRIYIYIYIKIYKREKVRTRRCIIEQRRKNKGRSKEKKRGNSYIKYMYLRKGEKDFWKKDEERRRETTWNSGGQILCRASQLRRDGHFTTVQNGRRRYRRSSESPESFVVAIDSFLFERYSPDVLDSGRALYPLSLSLLLVLVLLHRSFLYSAHCFIPFRFLSVFSSLSLSPLFSLFLFLIPYPRCSAFPYFGSVSNRLTPLHLRRQRCFYITLVICFVIEVCTS